MPRMSTVDGVPERELGPGEWAIIALLAEQPIHGWGLMQKLKPEGEIGAVWSLPRPAVYRSLEYLQQRGMIEQHGLERSQRHVGRAGEDDTHRPSLEVSSG